LRNFPDFRGGRRVHQNPLDSPRSRSTNSWPSNEAIGRLNDGFGVPSENWDVTLLNDYRP